MNEQEAHELLMKIAKHIRLQFKDSWMMHIAVEHTDTKKVTYVGEEIQNLMRASKLNIFETLFLIETLAEAQTLAVLETVLTSKEEEKHA